MDDQESLAFEMYKFLGDGWVLLFDTDVEGEKLMRFLRRLCERYNHLYKNRVDHHLEATPAIVGLKIAGQDHRQQGSRSARESRTPCQGLEGDSNLGA